MADKAFLEALEFVYRGEIGGEAAFEAMLAGAEDAEQRYVVGSLLQLETEGKAMLRPLMARYGLPLRDDAAIVAESRSAGEALAGMPWAEQAAALKDTVETNFLARYEELGALVAPDEDPDVARVATFMGRHERSLIETAERIMAGAEDPAAPSVALLHFPLPRPG